MGELRPVPGWAVVEQRGTAEQLHLVPVPDPVAPSVWVCEPTRPALVLGSGQRDLRLDAADLAALGVDLVRRRSGGGAVLVWPGRMLWVDLVVPRGHELWDDDVGRAMWWVGDRWGRALAGLGLRTTTHRGPMVSTSWSSLACFAGLGPGEVVDSSGNKVVGVSQRRQRHAARFQTMVHLGSVRDEGHPSAVAALLGLAPADATELGAMLAAGVRCLDCARSVALDALLVALSD